jgi:hypothetical protein
MAPEATSNAEARTTAIANNMFFILITPFKKKIIIFIKFVNNSPGEAAVGIILALYKQLK